MRGFSMAAAMLMLAALPGAVFAQAFSFGFATGGGHGHHHGCYGNWYGFDFYRPPVYRYGPPIYYAPPPVTYVYPAPAVQVVQPAVVPVQPSPGLSAVETTTPSLAASSASTGSSSGVRLNALPAAKQRANVVLRNPAENAGPVAFRVQDQVDAELSPGSARTWSDRTSITVEFDRGGDFGATRKVLRPGNYEFVVTDEGWDLVAASAPASNGRAASLQKNALPGRR